jgi:AAA domain
MKTIVINFISGAGCGKSLMAALTFAELKMKHLKAEYVQEYAKTLVWQKRFDELDNQYHVSTQQYNMIKAVDGAVDYIVCDSGLLIGVFYNRFHKTNVCDIRKTEQMLLNKMSEFHNIYILLKRNPEFPFEIEGRLQNEKEAINIDSQFKELLDELNLNYLEILSSKNSIPQVIDYIISNTKKDP